MNAFLPAIRLAFTVACVAAVVSGAVSAPRPELTWLADGPPKLEAPSRDHGLIPPVAELVAESEEEQEDEKLRQRFHAVVGLTDRAPQGGISRAINAGSPHAFVPSPYDGAPGAARAPPPVRA